MKTIEELLKNLARPEVLEFGLVTNRLPSVNIGGKFEPVDDEAPSTERLMQMLVTMGGSRYVDSLSDKPVQWTTRLDGVGVIAVAAILRKDIVQARFTVAKREGAGGRPSGQQPSAAARPSEKMVTQPASGPAVAARPSTQQPSARPPESRPHVPAPAPSPQPASGPKPSPSSGAQPHAPPASTQTRAHVALAGPPSSSSLAAAKAAQIQPQAIKSVGAAAHPVRVQPSPQTPPVQPAPPPPSSEDEWDDDEPTLQTLSPPVSGRPGAVAAEPRAKPARRPEEVTRDTDPQRAAQEKAAQERAAEEKAAQEKAAKEKAALEKAAQEKAAQEKAAQEKAAQERAAQEKAAQQKAAQEKAAQEKAAQEKAAAERAAAEKAAAEKAAAEKAAAEKAAAERAAAERAAQGKAAQDKAAAERAALDRATQERVARERAGIEQRAARERLDAQLGTSAPPVMGGRRFSTPTSVDAVDVEITTTDTGTGKRRSESETDLDADGAQSGVVSTKGSAAPVAVPAPSVIAEKDRPRVDPSATVDSFLAMAVAARASDLYIVGGRPILLRVATDLLPRTQAISAEHVERITREIVPVRLRETLDKEGSCDFAVEHPSHGRFRVNVARQRTGYELVLRVIPKELPTVAGLGLPEALTTALRNQRGLVLVTGPASHGKSTTLAALVDHLNRETARHVMTIEEPIEHVHPRKRGFVSQRDVGLHARTRTRTLQTSLREDTDVIVLGEMRDAESARHALVACESGRLVLGTMNASSAVKAIERLVDLFPPAELPWVRASLASSLRLVVGQRLVPSTDRTRLHAAVELLPWSVALYTLIRDGRTADISELQKRGKAAGIVRLDESLAELVRAQKVTLEVAKQFCESPGELEALMTRSSVAPAAQARKG